VQATKSAAKFQLNDFCWYIWMPPVAVAVSKFINRQLRSAAQRRHLFIRPFSQPVP